MALPKLTQPKKDLLDLHQGCYKCCTFYVGHFSHTCNNECPTLDACKKVTIAYALRAKATFEKASALMVATIFNTGLDDNYIEEDFINSDEFNEYVSSPTAPLLPDLPDHLWWDCCIDAPFTCTPSPIKALINHGTSPVLISEDMVKLYGIAHRTLFKPFAVSAAFITGQPKP